MVLESSQLMDLLMEFSSLRPRHRKIFLWCLEHCPNPRPYTGDLGMICEATGSDRRTVWGALRAIGSRRILSCAVCYGHVDAVRSYYDDLEDDYGELQECEHID